jgi:hypothetical protein
VPLKRDLIDEDEAKQAAEFLKKAARAAERTRARAATDNDVADAAVKPAPPSGGEKAA